MKKITGIVFAAGLLLSCGNKEQKGQFTVSGEVKNYAAKKIFLEQLYFDGKDPQLLDSAIISSGKFSVRSSAPEDGLYWLRLEGRNSGFLFINDQSKISFTADSGSTVSVGPIFNSPANSSFLRFMKMSDSLKRKVSDSYTAMTQLQQAGAQSTDSSLIACTTGFNNAKDQLTSFSFKYADTAKSPMVSMLAITAAPVEMDKFILPLENLSKRFPNHAGIRGVIAFAQQKIAESKQQQQQQTGQLKVGDMAPDITMPDTDGKPFSLSSLRGKYVLVDFWASWCGPCRAENPNVVSAFKKFSSKNFTILGVSLDKEKQSWMAAIKEDQLGWKQISDLKYWGSAAVGLYGIDGIPYNVLIDPQGKIIATSLREGALHAALADVLK